MRSADVNALYDTDYVSSYDDGFIHRDICRSDAEFEIDVLRDCLKDGRRWLDVACGTGYFLSRFPQVARAGADISKAMLEKARGANPDATFFEHDFRLERREWNDAWGLVSSMWYAYGYVDTMDEFDRFLKNLADWTAPDGTLFLPYLDINGLWELALPFDMPNPYRPSRVHIMGLVWSYVDGGKIHRNMMAPHVDYIREGLARRFDDITVIAYPPAMPEWKIVRKALIATHKKT